MLALIFIICIFLWMRSDILVMVYGRGILRPDFARVDKILNEKNSMHSALPQWNSTFGKIMYYLSLILTVLAISLFVFILISVRI